MATKTDKVSENEKLTAEIMSEGNQVVASEGTKQKLLEVVTAKINAMSVPQTSSSSENSGGTNPLIWIVLIMLALLTAVAIKKSKERQEQNVH